MDNLKFENQEELFQKLNERLSLIEIKFNLLKKEIKEIKEVKIELYKKLGDFK